MYKSYESDSNQEKDIIINLQHCLLVDTISLSSVMIIDHTQNEDDLYPKSPCHHTATETVLPCRDQLNEDIWKCYCNKYSNSRNIMP